MTDIIAQAKAALDGITPGPWEHRVGPVDETHAEYMQNTLSGGPALHVLIAPSDDERYAYVVPAITGDGPTSGRNAQFIVAARTLVPDLIAEVERLRAEVATVRSGAQTLGRIIERQGQAVLDIVGRDDLIAQGIVDSETGDGNWDVVWEMLAELPRQRDEARSEVERLRGVLSAYREYLPTEMGGTGHD